MEHTGTIVSVTIGAKLRAVVVKDVLVHIWEAFWQRGGSWRAALFGIFDGSSIFDGSFGVDDGPIVDPDDDGCDAMDAMFGTIAGKLGYALDANGNRQSR